MIFEWKKIFFIYTKAKFVRNCFRYEIIKIVFFFNEMSMERYVTARKKCKVFFAFSQKECTTLF